MQDRRLSPAGAVFFALCLASAAVWLPPLLGVQRGSIWGYYTLWHILAGFPLLLAAAVAGIIGAAAPGNRRKVALATSSVLIATLASTLAMDVGYSLFVAGAWRANYWLDRAHIPRQYSDSDPELGFVRKPFVSWRGEVRPGLVSEYRTDEHGFRNPPGLKRADVVFIGDSFTEAASVPDRLTFISRTAAATGLVAANLGRGAYGPQQELIVLKRYGLAYRPRYVVWQVFPGNDLDDAYEYAQWRKQPRSNVSLFRRYFNSSPIRDAALKLIGLPQKDVLTAELIRGDGSAQVVSVLYRPYTPKQAEFGLGELRRTLDEAHRICRERGIRLGVMVVPTMMRVLRPYLRLTGPANSSETFFLEEYVSRWSAESGFDYIDVLGPLSAEAARGDRDLYIPNDEHLDVDGHEVVGAAVTNWIRQYTNRAAK